MIKYTYIVCIFLIVNNSIFMKVFFLFFVFLFYTSFDINSCDNCKIILEPIGAVNLEMNEDLNTVLSKFESFENYSNYYVKLDDNEKYYLGKKKIFLPNGKKTFLKSILGFKNNKLHYFEMEFDIGQDSRYFFNDLIPILKEKDINKVNNYIYINTKYFNTETNEKCKKIFNVGKNQKGDSYCIFVKYSTIDNNGR